MNASDRKKLNELLKRRSKDDLDFLECIELNKLIEETVDDAEHGRGSLEKDQAERAKGI